MLDFLLAGGAFVGLLGILQFLGINLVPYVGDKVTFGADQVVTEGVRRVSSVYGHPNNLGLFMGRIWPLAAVLLLAALAAQHTPTRATNSAVQPPGHMGQTPGSLWHLLQRYRAVLFLGICLLLTTGGLLVSFSKGALLGAGIAVLLLALLLWLRTQPDTHPHRTAFQQHLSWRLVALLAGLLLAGGLLIIGALAILDVRIERLNPFGESSSVRIKLWASALAMLRDHLLLGIGLDQFQSYYQHYIHPSLLGTNEQYTSHPHNVLLDIWLRLGIPGLIAFGWLLVRFYQHTLAHFRLSLLQCGLAAAMTAALVHGLVDNFYFVSDLAFTFWLWLWLTE
jgi:O-antigen ligase